MGSSFADLHRRRVTNFEGMYSDVTTIMEKFRDNPENELSEIDRNWLTFLIHGFSSRYKHWLTEEYEYLNILYRQNNTVFTLAGHAYLHISLDLAVVIGESLCDSNGDLISFDERTRRGRIYSCLETALQEAILSMGKRPWQINALLAYRNLRFDSPFLAWIVSLRNAAWSHGLWLAEAKGAARADGIHRLRQRVAAHLLEAIDQFWMWAKIYGLRPPGNLGVGGVTMVILALLGYIKIPINWHDLSRPFATGVMIELAVITIYRDLKLRVFQFQSQRLREALRLFPEIKKNEIYQS